MNIPRVRSANPLCCTHTTTLKIHVRVDVGVGFNFCLANRMLASPHIAWCVACGSLGFDDEWLPPELAASIAMLAPGPNFSGGRGA